ncbi:MAG: hypothetical protein ACTSU2_08995 [Promethearchaeota archaeon]
MSAAHSEHREDERDEEENNGRQINIGTKAHFNQITFWTFLSVLNLKIPLSYFNLLTPEKARFGELN